MSKKEILSFLIIETKKDNSIEDKITNEKNEKINTLYHIIIMK